MCDTQRYPLIFGGKKLRELSLFILYKFNGSAYSDLLMLKEYRCESGITIKLLG